MTAALWTEASGAPVTFAVLAAIAALFGAIAVLEHRLTREKKP